MQRYQPIAGHVRRHRDSEEGETGQSGPPDNLHEQASQSEKTGVSEKVFEGHGCSDGGTGTDKKEADRIRGDGSNTQNREKGAHSQVKTNVSQEKGFIEIDKEHQETVGACKSTKKARKPDREFYQPGSRRNIQGKDCGVGRELDKPPPRKHEQKSDPESQLSTGEIEGKKKNNLQNCGGKDKKIICLQENVKLSKSCETNKKEGSRDVEQPPLSIDSTVEIINSKVEKLSIKERGRVRCETQELSCRRGATNDKGNQSQGGGKKEKEEKAEKKMDKGNRRRRGMEKEKDQDFQRGEVEVGSGGKNDRGKAEKEKKGIGGEGDDKLGRTEEAHQSKGRKNCRETRRGDNNNNNRPRETENVKTVRNVERAAEIGDRNKPNANITAPTSKRYSKSDIRRSQHRTYSSSSASSVTSLDGPGLGLDVENSKWPHSEPKRNNNEGKTSSGEGRRRHLHSWTINGESSTESMEGSEMSDITEYRRRRRRGGGDKELNAERRTEERNKPKGTKGQGSGILRISLDKQSGSSSHSGNIQHHKQALVPRGRGGGILVLPACTDISSSPEVGQRLLFGGIRGGSACRSRGGRGGGVRRLWDPNNPDQKPALARAQTSKHSSLQQPVYLQTGTGYGQLHFLDTDDEVAGSPPVPQGEHFRSQQAAAIGYYKFQNSDNPYGYPPNFSGSSTSQRYPYPYMGPYQMAPPNGIYPGPGAGQVCGSYRGTGYTQPAAGSSLTFEEMEQQARGELGRLLRAADAQELQLSNLLSRDKVSAEGLDRMTQLR